MIRTSSDLMLEEVVLMKRGEIDVLERTYLTDREIFVSGSGKHP